MVKEKGKEEGEFVKGYVRFYVCQINCRRRQEVGMEKWMMYDGHNKISDRQKS